MTRRWLAAAVLLTLILGSTCLAQEPDLSPDETERVLATVAYVADEFEEDAPGGRVTVQQLEVLVARGAFKGEALQIEQIIYHSTGVTPYRAGDRVYVDIAAGPDGSTVATISGRSRVWSLALMAVMFAALVLAVGRATGARSLLSLILGLGVVALFILPRIAQGADPLLVALLGSAIAMPLMYYVTHGINAKTTVALAASLVGIALAAGMALLATNLTHLTGFASDEAAFVNALGEGRINLLRLLQAGMVISVVGVLDDITVAQAAVVEQLAQADTTLAAKELFQRAMAVGHDHIGSMVNTLVLVYAGAALPLWLVLADRSVPLGYALSYESVAQEIVMTLVTSASLVAIVPLATSMAALVFASLSKRRQSAGD